MKHNLIRKGDHLILADRIVADLVDSAGQTLGGAIAEYLGRSGNPGHVLARRGKSGAE